MQTIKIISFVIAVPVYLFSLLFLLISVVGFGWGEGDISFSTFISFGFLLLATYLFRKILITDKKYTLVLYILSLFVSIFLSFLIVFSASR